jgi:uncharacterized protein YbjT (DUF2867 family)
MLRAPTASGGLNHRGGFGMFVITGATGNVGNKVSRLLLERGYKVRVIGRSADRLRELTSLGAEAAVGELSDVAFLKKAFTDATSVFAMIPPNMTTNNLRGYQNEIGETIAKAIDQANVRWVVNLSSLGAHLPERVGPVNGLFDQERRLEKNTKLNVVHLRPTFFMENFLMNIHSIRQNNAWYGAAQAEIRTPVVATQDVAAVAADHLVARDFTGATVRELLGPQDVTMNQIVETVGRAIGRTDLRYTNVPYADAEKAMTGFGFSADVARNFNELTRAINERVGIRAVTRTPRTWTPTTWEQFVTNTFVPAMLVNK